MTDTVEQQRDRLRRLLEQYVAGDPQPDAPLNLAAHTALREVPMESHRPAPVGEYQYRLAFMVVVDTEGEFSWDAQQTMLDRYWQALESVAVADVVNCTDLNIERMTPMGEAWS